MFITVEGCEGSGKSAIIKRLYEDLLAYGYNVILTREPGGKDSKIAEQIREVILNKENTEMDYMTEAMLYAASRRQHLVEVIKPALDKGYIVLCDRYIDSSFVYQGIGRGLGITTVQALNGFGIGNYYPDITILIDVDPEVGLARAKNRNKFDRLDLETLDFHKKVRQGYLQLAKEDHRRFKVLNGNKTPDEVYSELKKSLYVELGNFTKN